MAAADMVADTVDVAMADAGMVAMDMAGMVTAVTAATATADSVMAWCPMARAMACMGVR